MKAVINMNCLEFKRLALAEPNCTQHEFIEHGQQCADCLKYVGSIQKMDADLAASLTVPVPPELLARIHLARHLASDTDANQRSAWRSPWATPNAVAASLVAIGLAVGLTIGLLNPFSRSVDVSEEYTQLLGAVMEHTHEHAMAEVWGKDRANRSINAILASYDGSMQIKNLDSLQFGKICPMGNYLGLHATMDTAEGQVTFAYFKGNNVPALQDLTTEGYMARVKPVRGGSLVIISKTVKGLNLADGELSSAMYWDT